MPDNIKVLRDRRAALIKEAEGLAALDAEGKADDEQLARYAKLVDEGGELDQVNDKIKRAEKLMDDKRAIGSVDPDEPDADDATKAAKVPAEPKKPETAFKSFGEQLQAVAMCGQNKETHHPRMTWGNIVDYNAAATGANESVPSDGGFLVQTDFSMALLDLMHEQGDVASRVRRIPISANANGIKLPAIDETSRANGSRWGGVQAYWADEAATVTASRPKFREINMELKKLFGLAYSTEELLRDSTALESVMRQAFAEEMVFKTEDGIINGTGAGQMLGFLNSGAVITVSKDSGQAADTISTTNVLNMMSRLPLRSRRNAVWLINQDAEPQLWQLTLGSGTAVILLYRPPGTSGANATSPFGTLLGRPVIPIEQAATLGNAGDIMLVDLSQYLMIDKGAPAAANSMHVRFIYDEMTFRFIYRVDGQPAWKQAVTPKNGTATQSPFIVLEAR